MCRRAHCPLVAPPFRRRQASEDEAEDSSPDKDHKDHARNVHRCARDITKLTIAEEAHRSDQRPDNAD